MCVSLLLKVQLAVKRQQQRPRLKSQVLLLIVDIHGCQQVLCHCYTKTDISVMMTEQKLKAPPLKMSQI